MKRLCWCEGAQLDSRLRVGSLLSFPPRKPAPLRIPGHRIMSLRNVAAQSGGVLRGSPVPCSGEPWHPGPSLHMGVSLSQGQGWSDRGGAGRFSGQRKSSFAFWHKTLLILVLCTVITSTFSTRRCFQEGQQEGCSVNPVR